MQPQFLSSYCNRQVSHTLPNKNDQLVHLLFSSIPPVVPPIHPPGSQYYPEPHPCDPFPTSQNIGTHLPVEKERSARLWIGKWSILTVPSPSGCPHEPCTHRHDLRLPPKAGFSASPGTPPVRQPFSHKELYSNLLYS